jgi:SH3 domain protein
MKAIRKFFISALLILSSPIFAQTAAQAVEQNSPIDMPSGFISDELFIYMHSGAGTNYRILGSINAGTQVKLTGNNANNFTEIFDDKGRKAWVESKYVSDKPGLQFVIAELNSQIASASDNNNQLDAQLNQLKDTVNNLTNKNSSLTKEITSLNSRLINTQSKLKDQDTNIKKQWFFNGAIVLGIGLILGLILPRVFARRRSNMDSWE